MMFFILSFMLSGALCTLLGFTLAGLLHCKGLITLNPPSV